MSDWPRSPVTGRVVLGAAAGRTTMEETVERAGQQLVLLLLEAQLVAAEQRRRAHAERLARAAHHLGRALVRYEVTRAQVERRLDALVYAYDPELEDLIEIRLLDPAEGRRIAEAALALGMKEGRS